MNRARFVALLFWLAAACNGVVAVVAAGASRLVYVSLSVVFLALGWIWWRIASSRTGWQGDAVGPPGPGKVTVTLLESGTDKLASIKALRRAAPLMGLAEAKWTVDEANARRPAVVTRGATPIQARAIRTMLEAVGCKVGEQVSGGGESS